MPALSFMGPGPDRLATARAGLEEALHALGNGFLAHADNGALIAALGEGSVTPAGYFDQLLLLVYRLVLLLALEERDRLHPPGTSQAARDLYRRAYRVGRLCDRQVERGRGGDRGDSWESVKTVFRGLQAGEGRLGLPALGGLFAARLPPALGGIFSARLPDRALIAAMGRLAWVDQARRTEWHEHVPGQLGSLHEGLLELTPRIDGRAFQLTHSGRAPRARRASGSYYTPEKLIGVLMDRALDPVVDRAVGARPSPSAEALLDLAVVDPACGSGHFLLAAGRRLAAKIAEQRAGGAPSAEQCRRALCEVAGRCIYGVDRDPLAVELCKINLWSEAAEPGTPLSFFDARIRVGNSLLGAPLGPAQLDLPRWAEPERSFDWRRAFPEVFARGGFDAVLGNPPWIAHAGRAAQPLEAAFRDYCKAAYESFAGYPTTHGMFIALAAQLLRPSGAVGLIVPSSVSELPKYEATRRAHDRLCAVQGPLPDFGEGQFPGVTQPCMALISRRVPGGRGGEVGAPWPMERPDLDEVARDLLAALLALPPLPPELFGERGFQSDATTKRALVEAGKALAPHTLALREGTDVREFQLRPPRVHADPAALVGKIRGRDEYRAVRVLVRNTARYPIAALSDGLAFRNSLLAGFDSERWPAAALVALLNSSLVRWHHYQRFRDARQPILPQVKIGHLRAVPEPPSVEATARLRALGERLSARNAPLGADDRAELDELVFCAYGVGPAARRVVEQWRRTIHDRPPRRGQPASR